jgi:hypothetical protein
MGWFFGSDDPDNATSGWAKSAFLVLAGTAMVFAAIGYALRPVQKIVDDLDDSSTEEDSV